MLASTQSASFQALQGAIQEVFPGTLVAPSLLDETTREIVRQRYFLGLSFDAIARRLRESLSAAGDGPLAVIVTDAFGRPWREGQTNVAIGVAGLRPIRDYRGTVDCHGQVLRSTAIAVADELAAAAEMVMGKTLGIPIAIVSGSGVAIGDVAEGSGRDLLRRPEEDLFR